MLLHERRESGLENVEKSMFTLIRSIVGTLAFMLILAGPAHANLVYWRINEVYSNADGTIQFVEFLEINGQNGQGNFSSKPLKTYIQGASPNDYLDIYWFSEDLSTSTANRHALLATSGFESLDGAVVPDFIMPDNFIDLSQVVRINLADIHTIEFDVGDIPTDGVNSYLPDGPSVGANSPTNFAGEVGSIDLPEPDTALASLVALAALALLRGSSRFR